MTMNSEDFSLWRAPTVDGATVEAIRKSTKEHTEALQNAWLSRLDQWCAAGTRVTGCIGSLEERKLPARSEVRLRAGGVPVTADIAKAAEGYPCDLLPPDVDPFKLVLVREMKNLACTIRWEMRDATPW